jgi:hypothetical protein
VAGPVWSACVRSCTDPLRAVDVQSRHRVPQVSWKLTFAAILPESFYRAASPDAFRPENKSAGCEFSSRSNSGLLFFVFPTAELTFHALLSSAGKGRRRSTDEWVTRRVIGSDLRAWHRLWTDDSQPEVIPGRTSSRGRSEREIKMFRLRPVRLSRRHTR